jgi:hypothetical protein
MEIMSCIKMTNMTKMTIGSDDDGAVGDNDVSCSDEDVAVIGR